MLVIRRLFGSGTNCIAPSGLPLLLCLFPGLAPWAFLSRPCGASFAPETSYNRTGPRSTRSLAWDSARPDIVGLFNDKWKIALVPRQNLVASGFLCFPFSICHLPFVICHWSGV